MVIILLHPLFQDLTLSFYMSPSFCNVTMFSSASNTFWKETELKQIKWDIKPLIFLLRISGLKFIINSFNFLLHNYIDWREKGRERGKNTLT